MKIIDASEVKPYTNKQLAVLYGVSTRILRNWLRLHAAFIGPKKGHYFTSLQVKTIFERLGPPE
jgi:hypothetical protein